MNILYRSFSFFVLLISFSGCSFPWPKPEERPAIAYDDVSKANSPEEAIQALVAAQAQIPRSDVVIYYSERTPTHAVVFHQAFTLPDAQTGLRKELFCTSRLHLRTDGWAHGSDESSNCFSENLPEQHGVQCALTNTWDEENYIVFGRIKDDALRGIEFTVKGKEISVARGRTYFSLVLPEANGTTAFTTDVRLLYDQDTNNVTYDIHDICTFPIMPQTPRS